MKKGEILFNGNEKKIYSTENPDEVLIHFTDVISCYHNVKRAKIVGKGMVTNQISALIFKYLTEAGIRNHFIKQVNEREQLCRKIEIIPLVMVARSRVSGDFERRFRLKEGEKLNSMVIDLFYNVASLGDPLINDYHAIALGLVTREELNQMYATVQEAHKLLSGIFAKAGLELVDLQLEFGRDSNGLLIISDEISPDTCRFWDAKTGEKLDKDRFRHDMSDVLASYSEVLKRLSGLNNKS